MQVWPFLRLHIADNAGDYAKHFQIFQGAAIVFPSVRWITDDSGITVNENTLENSILTPGDFTRHTRPLWSVVAVSIKHTSPGIRTRMSV